MLGIRQYKQEMLRLLWVRSDKGLQPHISATKKLMVKLKYIYIYIYILLVLLAKICQDKERAHFYKLSVYYPSGLA
jgi:hypothetical protein